MQKKDSTPLNFGTQQFVLEQLKIYQENPNALSSDWVAFFQGMEVDHTSLFDIEMAGEEKQGGSSSQEYETDEDPYSEKNRWRRSTEIADPDHDDW